MSKNSVSEISRFNLIRLLKTFSRKEISELGKFVKSPFFNNQSTLIRLYDELIKYYPEFSNADITKEKLFTKIKPGAEFNDSQFRKYFSNLYKLAEEYLNYIENNSVPKRKNINLLYQFDKRNLNELYNRVLSESLEDSKKNNFISNDFFYKMYSVEEIKFIHHIRLNEQDKVLPDMIKSHQYVLLHLMLVTTVFNNILLVNKKLYKGNGENKYFEDFIKLFDFEEVMKNFENGGNEIKLFSELCRVDIKLSQDSADSDNLSFMKELIFKMAGYFNKNLLYTFLSHLNIYYFINLNTGNTKYEKELFSNYKYMIEKQLYEDEGQKFMNYSEFRSILLIALNLKEYGWAENFINEFGRCFNEDKREKYINYSIALLRFEMKEFEESLYFLSKIKPVEIFMKLDVNVLLALIYYEKNFTDSADSLSEAFKRYINSNNSLSEEVKTGHLNFLKFYRIILKFRDNKTNISELLNFKKEITENRFLRRRNWFLEKTEELLKAKQ